MRQMFSTKNHFRFPAERTQSSLIGKITREDKLCIELIRKHGLVSLQ